MNKELGNIQLNWKSKKSIPIFLLLLYYIFIVCTYLNQDGHKDIEKPSFLIITVLWVTVSLISMLEISQVRRFIKKHGKWIDGLLLLLTPIASFLMVEIMVSNFNMDMYKGYTFYNLIWYFIIYYLIHAVIRNCKLTIIIGNFLIYMAGLINYLVYLFRGNPILPSDLLAWQTGVSVASNYELSFSKGFLIATLIMLVVFVVGNKLENKDKKLSFTNRMIGLGAYVLFAAMVFNVFFHSDLIETKIKVLDFFAPKYTYSCYGTAFGFVANVEAMDTDLPDGYSVDQVEEAYKEESEKEAKDIVTSTDNKPNIIAIMNEAFSDLSMMGEYNTNMDYLPNIRALTKNTTKGALYVSVFGGATSDTEYEFLTGNSMAVMPQNCVPYQQFVTEPTDSLASTLKAQGYYNIAIHPYEPSGYKRDLVYPLLGFDEFLSMQDFNNPQRIRTFISDRESYKKVIEEYENKGKDQPLFIFNVTMQNHGGYSGETIFEEKDTVRLTDLKGYTKVEQYLSLLRESDKAFQSLIDYFAKQEEHTVILLFGDHQPVAYSEFHDALAKQGKVSEMEGYQRKYRVPFILWANYDISASDVDKISANYLSSYLLKSAGLKGTTYNHYLMDLYEEIPVINGLFYIDKNNQGHKFSEATAYSDLITQYRYIGYNNALDKKDRLKEFYRLKNE
ncbi:MAG: Phosphoglycerol transferase, alkaline phosphatase superfamily [Herbinix sp.]|nr:Phosphoglycerol transferase, alkaline phosphatase superfamily [Herbinix sp.]